MRISSRRRRVVARAAAFAGVVATLATAAVVATTPASALDPTGCQQPAPTGVPIPATAPRDPLLDRLGLDRAWPVSRGGGVTVGVVDSGVSPANPKLAGAVQDGVAYAPVSNPSVYAATAGGQNDCEGHGTEVAGIIAARTDDGDDRMSGVAPAATIYPVAISGQIGQAPSALIGAAIRDAADHASVINLSFARPVDDADVKSAVEYAQSKNVVVVAAAGNEDVGTNTSGETLYPAAYPGVLSVAAVGPDGLSLASSNSGSWISVGAPGESLTTVAPSGTGFLTVTGTSFAAAVVSGQVALLRAAFPGLSAAQVVERVQATAVPPGDADVSGRDNTVGHGVIDVFASLSAALPASASAGASAGTSGTAVSNSPAPVPVGTVAIPQFGGVDPRAVRAHETVGIAALLGIGAVVALLGALAIRAARRRGWRAGRVTAGARHAGRAASATRAGADVAVTSDGIGSDSDDELVEANEEALADANGSAYRVAGSATTLDR